MTPQFRTAVTTYGPRFMIDLGLARFHVGGIFGNLAVESDQFRALQEYKPTVRGSKGGWGWPQWTGYGKGGRRGLFEAWADKNGFKRDDPEAFYQFMLVELRGSEKAALTRLKRTRTLDSATEAFMKGYERPGVPHLDERKAFALEALRVLEAVTGSPTAEAIDGVDVAGAEVRLPPATPLPGPTLAAPRVMTVAAPTRTEARSDLPFWARWFVRKKPVTVSRPGLRPGGNPDLYDVQTELRARSYYTKMPPDGLDGPITQAAVAQARKDNGLGDGGVDAAFLAALDTMPNRLVPAEKANASLREAARLTPELFRAPAWLGTLGLGSLGLGGADSGGLLDKVQETTGRVNDVAGSVQSAIGTVSSVVGFVAEHRGLFMIAVGVFVLFKAASYALDAWIKVRTAFF